MKYFFFFSILLLFSGVQAKEPLNFISAPNGIHFQGTSYAAYSGDEKLWEIHVKKMEGNRSRLKAKDVSGVLYRKEKPLYTLKSPVAYLNVNNNNIIFPDGVILRSPKGESVEARVMVWDAAKKKFFGSKGVQVDRLNTRLKGDRLILGEDFQTLVLEGDVKAEVVP